MARSKSFYARYSLLILMAFFFEYATELPDFPFLGMLGFGVGCVLLLIVYYGFLRVFGR